ncbi:hypothetical protein IB234_11740 [Pseudomonas sp. PDM16]|uniref:hypothetical protein n=1 Tax=Pseudomonas sp. PDM16 TaxID=2769292 RepID=UPI0017860E65|nr:hypothetical protein [Pseudomonas sp. PDM16]MBD9415226.1 hypothetical protein [Pseudomonas sp. PDM16]
MDWGYFLFTAEQAFPSCIVMIAPVPFLAFNALPGRRLMACLPNLFALVAFSLACCLSATPGVEKWQLADYVPIVGLTLTTVLLVPSVLALRRKWFAVVHIVTMASAALTFFLAGMAIAHDWL